MCCVWCPSWRLFPFPFLWLVSRYYSFVLSSWALAFIFQWALTLKGGLSVPGRQFLRGSRRHCSFLPLSAFLLWLPRAGLCSCFVVLCKFWSCFRARSMSIGVLTRPVLCWRVGKLLMMFADFWDSRYLLSVCSLHRLTMIFTWVMWATFPSTNTSDFRLRRPGTRRKCFYYIWFLFLLTLYFILLSFFF